MKIKKLPLAPSRPGEGIDPLVGKKRLGIPVLFNVINPL